MIQPTREKESLQLEVEKFLISEIEVSPLTPEQFLTEVVIRKTMRRQDIIIISLLSMLGLAILATLGIFYLQGFGTIHLDTGLLHWLGATTIGEVASLLFLGIKYSFGGFFPGANGLRHG